MGKAAPNEKTSVAGKLFSGVLFIGVPLFAFWSLAALLVSQGLSRWIAGPIGGSLVLVPLLWHAIGERKRKKVDQPKKGMLSGRDRLGLRMLLVVGIALAVMFGLMRDKTVSALKAYGDWPLHGASADGGSASANARDLLRLVPNTKQMAIIDIRAGGPAWKSWLDRKMPKQLRALDYHTIVWTREIAAVVSESDLVQQIDRLAKADGRSVPVRGDGRFWSKGSRAAYVSPTTMVWGSDVGWVEGVAEKKNASSGRQLLEAAARVKPGAMFVLLDRSGTWLGIPGIHDTAIAIYRSGGRIRVEASVRYKHDPPMIHVELNIRGLVARAFGTANSLGLPTERTKGLTVRREGNIIYAELVRPAADIEHVIERARRTGRVETKR